jgi:hypothetical protein
VVSDHAEVTGGKVGSEVFYSPNHCQELTFPGWVPGFMAVERAADACNHAPPGHHCESESSTAPRPLVLQVQCVGRTAGQQPHALSHVLLLD